MLDLILLADTSRFIPTCLSLPPTTASALLMRRISLTTQVFCLSLSCSAQDFITRLRDHLLFLPRQNNAWHVHLLN